MLTPEQEQVLGAWADQQLATQAAEAKRLAQVEAERARAKAIDDKRAEVTSVKQAEIEAEVAQFAAGLKE